MRKTHIDNIRAVNRMNKKDEKGLQNYTNMKGGPSEKQNVN